MNRLTFWFSNIILLRGIVSEGVEHKDLGDGPCIKGVYNWLDPETFLVALEKVESKRGYIL